MDEAFWDMVAAGALAAMNDGVIEPFCVWPWISATDLHAMRSAVAAQPIITTK